MTSSLNNQLYEASLDLFMGIFPEEADNISKHRSELLSYFNSTDAPLPGSPLLDMHYSSTSGPQFYEEFELTALTPCQTAVGVASFDSAMFIIGLLGLKVANEERLNRVFLSSISPDVLTGLAADFHNFSVAETATLKAKALIPIFSGIYKAGCFKALYGELKKEMTIYDWIKTGVAAFAQLAIWFASDGVAFAAKVALNILSATQLIQDSLAADKACSQ